MNFRSPSPSLPAVHVSASPSSPHSPCQHNPSVDPSRGLRTVWAVPPLTASSGRSLVPRAPLPSPPQRLSSASDSWHGPDERETALVPSPYHFPSPPFSFK
ncbi:hypothetical protein DPEC_G00291460 [Dallia pectoralis]|uniref:Uncharacterized protein n=1 Tax=Dallia pectoralis TaxID=75939 RepID=A0ACC2FHQ0_DALPE|nr:hypothetical protein DPEC_G00291460 [Dallia pectoralis]